MKSWFTSVKSFVNSVIDVEKDVSDFRGNWLQVQKFFQTVQRSSDAQSLQQLEAKLPLMESHLDRMIELLLRERDEFSDAIRTALPPDSPVSIGMGGALEASVLRSIVTELPPCYRYLLRDPSTAATSSSSSAEAFDHPPHHQQGELLAHSSAHAPVNPSDNDYILFNLCQYAKHDMPTGSRRMLLHFLYRVLTEVDLPLPSATQHSGLTLASLPPPVSLLHICRNFATLPIVDCVHKVALAVDPWVQPGGRRSPVPVITGGSASHHAAAAAGGSGKGHLQAVMLLQQDRAALVALCRVLCEKLEQFPHFAEYFIVDDIATTKKQPTKATPVKEPQQKHRDPSATDTSADDVDVQNIIRAAKAVPHARCFLLDQLVPYVKDHCVDLSTEQRLQTVTNAMRGILALAKCVDPKLQDFVSRHVDLRSLLLHETCTTILTVSKVPLPAEELRLNMGYVTQVANFVDALLTLSPQVAGELQLAAEFESHVVVDTLMNLFRSPDERVYLAAVTIITEFLKQSFSAGHSLLGNRIVTLLLKSRVNTLGADAGTGHSSPSRTAGGRTSPTPQLVLLSDTTNFSADQLDTSVTFADAFFYPRLADMSDTVVCCTIQLFVVMCQRFPHSFMTHALQLDSVAQPLFFSRDFLKAHAKAPTHAQLGRANTAAVTTQHEHDLARLHAPAISFSKNGLVPDTTVNRYFPTRLYSPKGLCGTTMEQFSDDTLKLMLILETAMTTPEVLSHRLSIEKIPKEVLQAALQANARNTGTSTMTAVLGLHDDAAASAEAIAELASHRSTAAAKRNCAGWALYHSVAAVAQKEDAGDCSVVDALPVKYHNLFFSPSVHQSTLVTTLCRLVECFVDHSFAINTTLTELLVSLIALPDLRVAFTLLSEQYHPPTASRHHHRTAQAEGAASAATEVAAAVDPTNVEGRLALALKRVTSRIDAVFEREEQQQQDAAVAVANGHSPSRSGGINPAATSLALYWRSAQRPFFDPMIDDQVADEAFVSTLRATKQFVDACLALEGLRHELDSAVCYHVMGQRFSELSSAPQR